MPRREGWNAPDGSSGEEERSARRLTGSQLAGIVLIAAVLFNLQNVVIPPGGREDGMMLVVLAGMLIAGAILLGLPVILKRNRPREK